MCSFGAGAGRCCTPRASCMSCSGQMPAPPHSLLVLLRRWRVRRPLPPCDFRPSAPAVPSAADLGPPSRDCLAAHLPSSAPPTARLAPAPQPGAVHLYAANPRLQERPAVEMARYPCDGYIDTFSVCPPAACSTHSARRDVWGTQTHLTPGRSSGQCLQMS